VDNMNTVDDPAIAETEGDRADGIRNSLGEVEMVAEQQELAADVQHGVGYRIRIKWNCTQLSRRTCGAGDTSSAIVDAVVMMVREL